MKDTDIKKTDIPFTTPKDIPILTIDMFEALVQEKLELLSTPEYASNAKHSSRTCKREVRSDIVGTLRHSKQPRCILYHGVVDVGPAVNDG